MKDVVRQTGNQAIHRFRRRVREMWQSRGGGFYGFVAVLTFLYLEALDLGGDIAALPGAFSMSVGFVISWMVGNLVDAVLNLVRAAIWPVTWIGRFGIGVQSALLLGGAYAAYRLARPLVLRLLQDPEEPAALGAAATKPPPRP